MNSPFPPSSSAPGNGRIVVGLLPSGESGLEVVSYQYPLKLIAPSAGATARGGDNNDDDDDDTGVKKSALVFLLSYGGGLVAGDQVSLAIDVRPRARLSLVTQGHTKVFKAPVSSSSTSTSMLSSTATIGHEPVVTRQTLRMHVAAGAALCLLPDPVQPFADSVYEQLQVVRLAGGGGASGGGDGASGDAASLCLLDWVTQGRGARGENWSFTRWTGRNEVWQERGPDRADRLLVRDAVLLAPGLIEPAAVLPSTTLRDAMHGLAVFGTLILRGPLVDALGRFFLAEFAALPRLGGRDFREGEGATAAIPTEKLNEPSSHDTWRASRLQLEHDHGVLWSAAAVRGCVVVKFGARSVEGARLWIGGMLACEDSIAAVFGEQALMCVR